MQVDNYKLTLIKNGKQINITEVIEDGISWKDNVDTLGVELNFEIAHNDAKYIVDYEIVPGDFVILSNNGKDVFQGIVVDEDSDDRFSRSYTAYDFAFYLNQSKTIVQFNKMRADEAIKQQCAKFGVPIGGIANMPTLVKKIYKDEEPSEIFKDIIEQTELELGKKFIMEMRAGLFYIEEQSNLAIKAYFKQADNLHEFDVTKAIIDVSKKRSIKDLRNSIIIHSGDEKTVRVEATSKDDESIARYGLLQETKSVDGKDIAQARNIANNLLKELNTIAETTSIELFGSDEVRAGRIMEIEEPISRLSGRYLIKESKHEYSKRVHTMELKIEGIK